MSLEEATKPPPPQDADQSESAAMVRTTPTKMTQTKAQKITVMILEDSMVKEGDVLLCNVDKTKVFCSSYVLKIQCS